MTEAPSRNLLRFAILFQGGLGLAACLIGWVFSRPLWATVQFRWDAVGWGMVACAPLVVGMILLDYYSSGQRAWKPLAELSRIVRRMIHEMFAEASLLDLAFVSLLAGVSEELLFRALIQTALCQWTGVAIGLSLASLLFGLAHLVTKTYAVLATLIGLYLGWLWLCFGNLLVPVTTHALYDLIAILYLLRRHTRDSGLVEPEQMAGD